METLLNNLNGIFIALSVYFSICMITTIVSLWFIFKKENIPAYYSLIPFLNIYKYFKICGLPFWTIFVPIVNVITLYCSSYIIAKKYRFQRWQCLLAIFFPFVFLPLIAFSNRKNIDFIYNNTYIKNNKDIDKLENSLENNTNYEIEIKPEINVTPSESVSTNDELINNIEQNISMDEYVYDDVKEVYETKEDIPKPEEQDEFIEIADDIDINNLSLKNMDELEKNIEVENSTEKNIIKEEKDFKEVGPSTEAIAFGGEKKIENIDANQTKNDELKCPRCGSSLIGANGFCPGCGMKL